MSALEKLVDKAIETCSPSNGAELARRLNVSRSSVSLWRQGRKIDPNHLTALIHIAQADAMTAVEVLREQAATRPEREVWGSLARRLGAAAAVAVAALMPLGNVQAGTLTGHESITAVCIMRNRIRDGLRRLLGFVGPSRLAHAA